MMTIQITCPECGSGINIYPGEEKQTTHCDICHHEVTLNFKTEHKDSVLQDCVFCERKDFYQQRDFNRKIGATLFVIAAILSIWTYGISLIVLYLVDLLLFKKLPSICICYNCKTIYRNVENLSEIHFYDHEMNDRIVYSGHDFKGKPLSH